MKKLPKIFHNELTSKLNNNKKIYNSLDDNKEIKIENKKELSVREKVKNLIKDNNYIFNKKVILVFDNLEKETYIAGVVNNHIITMENEIIKIDDLKDIKY